MKKFGTIMLFCLTICSLLSCKKDNETKAIIENVAVSATNSPTPVTAQEDMKENTLDIEPKVTQTPSNTDPIIVKSEIFKSMGKFIGGFGYDKQDNMYIGSANKIMKISLDGTVTDFVDLYDLPGSTKDTSLYSFCTSQNGELYVCATDRIVSLGMDGSMKTILSGEPYSFIFMATDRDGNIYYASKNKVYRLSPDQVHTEFITVDESITKFEKGGCIAGMTFDSEESYFYIATSLEGKVLQYPVDEAGNAGTPLVIDGFQDPVYLAADLSQNVYAINNNNEIVKITKEGMKQSYICNGVNGGIYSFAFGSKAFDVNCIYATDRLGVIRKVFMDQNNNSN